MSCCVTALPWKRFIRRPFHQWLAHDAFLGRCVTSGASGQPHWLRSSCVGRSVASCVQIYILIEFTDPIQDSFFLLAFPPDREDAVAFLLVVLLFFVLFCTEPFYACREKSVVTPDRLASPLTLTRELQANQGVRQQIVGQCSACAVDFVCVRASSRGVVAQPKPWSSAPVARGLSWTAFCSTCWTEPGTSSASSAASANAIWQRNVFLEREDCTAKMISLGKHGRGGTSTHHQCFCLIMCGFMSGGGSTM